MKDIKKIIYIFCSYVACGNVYFIKVNLQNKLSFLIILHMHFQAKYGNEKESYLFFLFNTAYFSHPFDTPSLQAFPYKNRALVSSFFMPSPFAYESPNLIQAFLLPNSQAFL